jgi:hypothetical protein
MAWPCLMVANGEWFFLNLKLFRFYFFIALFLSPSLFEQLQVILFTVDFFLKALFCTAKVLCSLVKHC